MLLGIVGDIESASPTSSFRFNSAIYVHYAKKRQVMSPISFVPDLTHFSVYSIPDSKHFTIELVSNMASDISEYDRTPEIAENSGWRSTLGWTHKIGEGLEQVTPDLQYIRSIRIKPDRNRLEALRHSHSWLSSVSSRPNG